MLLALGPEGKLAAGTADGLIRIWDKVQSSEPIVFRGDLLRVQGLAYSPDGNHLVSAGGSGRVNVWKSEGGQGFVNATGRLLASAGRGQLAAGEVAVWDIDQRKTVFSFKENKGAITALAFGKDEFLLAVAGADRNIRLLDVKQKDKSPLVLSGHGDRVLAVAFDPSGARLTSGCDDDSIRLWNARTGSRDKVLTADPKAEAGHKNGVVAVAFSPDGRLLASGSFDKTVRIWDLEWKKAKKKRGPCGPLREISLFGADRRPLNPAKSVDSTRPWQKSCGTRS